jgi:hypothetical protein
MVRRVWQSKAAQLTVTGKQREKEEGYRNNIYPSRTHTQ